MEVLGLGVGGVGAGERVVALVAGLGEEVVEALAGLGGVLSAG